ncbi:MAG: NUDIX hydrolase [Geminicoccaceae bacterium]|nr:NUDIX hydrolase [Geminicoccaceae bacterium]
MDLLWRLAYRLAHAALRLWWAVRRPSARGAAVAVWSEGRLLVVETSYRPGLIDLPGGAVERGERPIAAALRELAEETGIEAPETALEPPVALAFTFERRRIESEVFAWRPSRRPTVRVDGREVVRATWLAPEEAARQRPAPGLALYLARIGDPWPPCPGMGAPPAGRPSGAEKRANRQGSTAGGAESGGRTPPQTSPT